MKHTGCNKLTQESSETELLVGDEGEDGGALCEGHLGHAQPLQRSDGDPQLGEVLLAQQRVVGGLTPSRDHVFLRLDLCSVGNWRNSPHQWLTSERFETVSPVFSRLFP